MLSGWISLFCAQAGAEEVLQLDLQLLNEAGAPLSNHPVRVVVGGGDEARQASAGKAMRTDSQGRVRLETRAPVKTRRLSLDNPWTRHRAQTLEVGVQLDLRGRPVRYCIVVDKMRQGTAGLMKAYVAGSDGRFTKPLEFHPKTHTWSIPGDPEKLMMTGIGAELKQFQVVEGGGGGRLVKLVLLKQESTQR